MQSSWSNFCKNWMYLKSKSRKKRLILALKFTILNYCNDNLYQKKRKKLANRLLSLTYFFHIVIAMNSLICQNTNDEQSLWVFQLLHKNKSLNSKPTSTKAPLRNTKVNQSISPWNKPLKSYIFYQSICLRWAVSLFHLLNHLSFTRATQTWLPFLIIFGPKTNKPAEPTRTQPCRTYRLHIPDNRGIV